MRPGSVGGILGQRTLRAPYSDNWPYSGVMGWGRFAVYSSPQFVGAE